ncbi:MAG: sulfatase-like hydrolase/transferase [Candidatus Hydrogenedens sp.]|nr:sulfatase-like hydrolase/transferase [Candidatus Hydrogenedens sp.]
MTPSLRSFRGLLPGAVSHAAAYGLLFVLLEWTKAARASQWAGFSVQDTGAACIATLIYAAIIALLALILAVPLSRIAKIPERWRLMGTTAASAIGVWCVLSVHRETYPTADDALVLAAVLAVAGVQALGGALAAAGAMLCAIGALWAATHYFLFDASRELWASAVPAGWCALCAVVLLLLSRFRRPTATGIAGLLLSLLPLAAYGMAVWQPWRGHEDPRPNLVFVISDTLRADHLKCYGGSVPTPRLDAFAKEGTRFENAYSLAPWTMPSMAGLFASDYPPGLTPDGGANLWLGQTWNYVQGEHPPTIAEVMRGEGYATGAFVANALVWAMPNVMDGFEQGAFSHPIMLVPPGWTASLPFLHAVLEAWFPGAHWRRPRDTTQAMNRYAEAWLRRHAHEPFLLYVHYIDPHAPYDPPAQYRTRTGPWPFFYPYPGAEAYGQQAFDSEYHVDEANRSYVASLYEGEVRYVDDFAGRLLDTLDGLGLKDTTYVCFTSDHGEELWEHGGYGHAHTVYNELMRVPLIFRGPDIAARAIDTSVSAIDVMPTLFDLLGLPAQDHWKGRSLGPVLRGEAETPVARPIFAQGTNNRCFPYPLQMAIDGQYKLIREDGTGKTWVYDLKADPGEQHDLSLENPVVASAMRMLMRQWMESFPYAMQPGADAGIESETVEQLRGMGYL